MNIFFPATRLSSVSCEVPRGDVTCRCLVHAEPPFPAMWLPTASQIIPTVSTQFAPTQSFTPLGSAYCSWWKPLFPFLTQLYMYNPSGRPSRSNEPV